MVELGNLKANEKDFIFTPVEIVAKEILRELLVMQTTSPGNLNSATYRGRYDKYDAHVKNIISVGWAYLETNGLIIQNPAKGNYWFFISRKGKEFKNEESWEILEAERFLPRKLLLDDFKKDIWPLFIHKQYDTAIFQAFKLLEVAVRENSKLPSKDLGVTLMRKAFKPSSGPLNNKTEENGEQEALMHLYAGAIGRYKNPQSHRVVGEDNPTSTAEKILLANHLIRLISFK